jgi:hypothetical protein
LGDEFGEASRSAGGHIAAVGALNWLQRLLKKRQTIRFDYLLKTRDLDCSLYETLDAISERLDAGWSDAEENAVQACNLHYGEISH